MVGRTNKGGGMKPIWFRGNREQFEKLREFCKEQNLGVNFVIERLIRVFLKQPDPLKWLFNKGK
jgi:hypothetical protein